MRKLPTDKKKAEDAFNLAKRAVKIVTSVWEENYDWAFSIVLFKWQYKICAAYPVTYSLSSR